MIREATVSDVAAIRASMKSIPGFWNKTWRRDVLERGLRSVDGQGRREGLNE